MDYFGSLPKDRQALAALPPNPLLDSMTRECERPYSQRTGLVDADARQFGDKTKLYISCPHPLSKKRSRAIDGTISRCSALLRICASF